MKRFLLFAGEDYYPSGGAMDFQASFDTIEEALENHDPLKYNYDGGWANIFDSETEKIVKSFGNTKWADTDDHFQIGK